jgi:hypothetical protein
MISTVNFSGVTADLSHGSALPGVVPVELVQKFARAMSAAQPLDPSLQPPEFAPHRAEAVEESQHAIDAATTRREQALTESYNPMTAVNVIHLRA